MYQVTFWSRSYSLNKSLSHIITISLKFHSIALNSSELHSIPFISSQCHLIPKFFSRFHLISLNYSSIPLNYSQFQSIPLNFSWEYRNRNIAYKIVRQFSGMTVFRKLWLQFFVAIVLRWFFVALETVSTLPGTLLMSPASFSGTLEFL